MKQVLVIEDNPENLRLISYALKRGGYGIVSAETGEEGIELVASTRPEFIIVDISLPGIDGLEVTRRIRRGEAEGRIPIIAITSLAMAGDRERVLEAGCDGYFEKPIDPLTIMERIHRITGAQR
ncbi:hypothetical protein DESUT3_04970 [Desulfuromonas versatilis]|uniref:Response regulatory domain-containing protein n=1 Tax=Desulfuromonas versatilis TaxID=2802975 RepID=A0ABN6DTG2_9BACT|nr:response regulator [Desulfuromonas versatilis]BCR03428.1 hypothetical protein DESUT3_04970 [Desulfuromonas versatilis]